MLLNYDEAEKYANALTTKFHDATQQFAARARGILPADLISDNSVEGRLDELQGLHTSIGEKLAVLAGAVPGIRALAAYNVVSNESIVERMEPHASLLLGQIRTAIATMLLGHEGEYRGLIRVADAIAEGEHPHRRTWVLTIDNPRANDSEPSNVAEIRVEFPFMRNLEQMDPLEGFRKVQRQRISTPIRIFVGDPNQGSQWAKHAASVPFRWAEPVGMFEPGGSLSKGLGSVRTIYPEIWDTAYLREADLSKIMAGIRARLAEAGIAPAHPRVAGNAAAVASANGAKPSSCCAIAPVL
jgi:hypothetical protein